MQVALFPHPRISILDKRVRCNQHRHPESASQGRIDQLMDDKLFHGEGNEPEIEEFPSPGRQQSIRG